MTTVTVNVQTLKSMIARLVKAEIATSWKGSQDPADHTLIEADLKKARAELKDYLTLSKENKS